MSKIILVCFKDPKQGARYRRYIQVLAHRLVPDNIASCAPLIKGGDTGVLLGVINPSETLFVKNTSVCLGSLLDPDEDWWRPKAKTPDGSYGLFRSDEAYVELLTDVVASRTIWYAQTENLFVASSSQRAIVSLLEGFEPNDEVSLWMLSSGSLGPGLSWDRRIKCLPGNARLCLNRSTWQLSLEETPVTFDPVDLPLQEHESRLTQALDRTFGSLHLRLDYSKWILPLSGGFDSRAILLLLKDRNDVRCITWGLKSSLTQQDSDAFVARSLAERLNVKHRYFVLDGAEEPVEKVFDRFLVAGEGRVDHISGYTDGFALWKTLFQEKVWGIIRGDEGFGWVPVKNGYEVRKAIGLTTLSDLWDVDALARLGLGRLGIQRWPDNLRQRETESLSTWRDRLYHEWRVPFILAALNELKSSYVETTSPLLSRNIVAEVRKMPDFLRTGKMLFRRIVHRLNPQIGFAKYPAIGDRSQILGERRAVSVISDELSSSYARSLLPGDFVGRVQNQINNQSEKIPTSPGYQIVSRFMNVLAFRVYVICKMSRMMSADARACRDQVC